MRECPWCGRQNLNVYVYCQGCGRGFTEADIKPKPSTARRWYWPFGSRAAWLSVISSSHCRSAS